MRSEGLEEGREVQLRLYWILGYHNRCPWQRFTPVCTAVLGSGTIGRILIKKSAKIRDINVSG